MHSPSSILFWSRASQEWWIFKDWRYENIILIFFIVKSKSIEPWGTGLWTCLTGDYLDYVNWSRKTHSLWEALFPGIKSWAVQKGESEFSTASTNRPHPCFLTWIQSDQLPQAPAARTFPPRWTVPWNCVPKTPSTLSCFIGAILPQQQKSN